MKSALYYVVQQESLDDFMSRLCCNRLRMNMGMFNRHMGLVESYMSNGLQKLLLV